MALSSSQPDSTMTPPPTPTSPRFGTLPIRNNHTASSAGNRKDIPPPSDFINTVLSGYSNVPTCATHTTMSEDNPSPSHFINTALTGYHHGHNYSTSARLPSSSTLLYTSPDGVLENSTPYTILHESPVGTGLWSSVYLATPKSAGTQTPRLDAQPQAPSLETPPATPVRRRGQSNSVSSTDSYTTQFSGGTASSGYLTTRDPETSGSAIWAIKAPADRAAFSVIRSEARMLSYIFSHTSPAAYMVPFLGLDPRSGALLMQALPLTLEDFIRGDLASIPEAQRSRIVASLFPNLAAKLLTGLEWLHEDVGIVHADIKPSNILLRPTTPGVADAMLQQRLRASLTDEGPLERPSLLVRENDDDVRVLDFEPLYTDFSAAIPLRPFPPSPSRSPSSDPNSPPVSPTAPPATAPPPHLAGGTWDFLAPELCRLNPPPVPSPASDVYALGVTFLCLVLGESPFESMAAGNAFRKREMVKMGDAVGFAKMVGRFAVVKREMAKRFAGWDWEAWLRRGLVKGAEARVGAREWRGGIVGGGVV